MSRELKIEAARAALEEVRDGMRLGIGTGSTADEFIRLLGAKVADGFKVTGVPTSERTRTLCEEYSIPLATLEELPELDLVVDGADEVDRNLDLIKGAGGALLREKIVAYASSSMVVIADESKRVDMLGAFPLPIEVDKFGMQATWNAISRVAKAHGLEPDLALRGGNVAPCLTDGGHLVLDASFRHIPDPVTLSTDLLAIPGVVETGLFLGYANVVFLAGGNGLERLVRQGQ